MRTSTLLMLSMAALGCGALDPREMRRIPAHWVEDTDTVEPHWHGPAMLDAVSFSSPSDGWLAGFQFLLHLKDDTLSYMMLRPRDVSLQTIDMRGRDDGWAGGSRLDRERMHLFPPSNLPSVGVIWRYRGGRWEDVDLAPLWWRDWRVIKVRATATDVWALLMAETGERDHLNGVWRISYFPVRFDGTAWRVEEPLRAVDARVDYLDMCFAEDGTGWFVGAEIDSNNVSTAIAVRRHPDRWGAIERVGPSDARSGLRTVACLADGRAVAVGGMGPIEDPHQGVSVLFRYDGVWQRTDLPGAIGRGVEAMAAVSYDDIWLAVTDWPPDRPKRAAFLHWLHEDWTEVPAPVLSGVGQNYMFNDMQFVSPVEGWAVADNWGAANVHGLIFHYKDGVWRNRNWNRHFWDQPWFGLLGD